jgi:Transferase family
MVSAEEVIVFAKAIVSARGHRPRSEGESMTGSGTPVSIGPRLTAARTVRAGRPSDLVVECGLVDISLANLPTSVVFFYPHQLDVDRLADGLAVALGRLPVFGGRLRATGDSLQIVCDDSGVPLDAYRVDEDLPEAISRMTLPESGFVDHVQAARARLADLPLLTARVSELADGATAVGCSWHHAVGDMQSFLLFMHTWSAACRNLPLPEAVLVTDRDGQLLATLPERDSGRPSFRLPDAAESELLRQQVMQAALANRSVQIYFTDSEIDRLRADLSDRAGRRLSVNDALCAHLLSTIRLLDGSERAYRLLLPVNVRRHLELPAGLVGNLVSEIYLGFAADATAEQLAGAIRNGVDNFAQAHLSLRTNHDYLAGIGRSRLADCVPLGLDPAQATFTISNWSRFGVYDVVFGDGRPACFSPAANLQLAGVSWLVEGFDSAGMLCTIALPARLAARARGADGRAALHRYRRPDEQLPELATAIRKLA